MGLKFFLKQIRKAQKEYRNELIAQGVSEKEAIERAKNMPIYLNEGLYDFSVWAYRKHHCILLVKEED